MRSGFVVRAVLFDMDGTLIDTMDLIAECWSQALKAHGYSVSKEDIYRAAGLPAVTIMKMYTGVEDPELHSSIRSYANKCFEERLKSKDLLFPRVKETLLELKKNGLLLGVATSSSCKRARALLAQAGVAELFDVVQCLEEGMSGKPEPDVLVAAIKKLGVSPREAIYVGDSLVDCIAASNAGVKFVLVARSWSSTSSILGSGCGVLAVIEDVAELPRVLKQAP
ncbi:MAG: haloacid dehalogenase [Thermoprotei archaeon]|nr:MAG: haloacid dehalogenase [Thermoprotei archaeon]